MGKSVLSNKILAKYAISSGGGGGSSTWGSITGTLSSQSDLATALNNKVTKGGDTGATLTIGTTSAHDLNLITNNSTALTVGSYNGSVGIGVIYNNLVRLSIKGIGSLSNTFAIQCTNSSNDLTFTVANNGAVFASSLGTGSTKMVVADALGNLSTDNIPSGTVSSVTGTTNRVSVINTTTTPVVDIDSAYVGQTSITTLGTVTTGVWQGTTVGYAYGGTSFTSYSSGDILYGLVGGGLAKLSIGTANQILQVINSGGNLIPSWTSSPTLTGYLKQDGTTPLTANWPAGNYSITANSVILGSSSNTIALGSSSGGDGTITTTTNATKGQLTISPLTIDESAGRVGVNKSTGISGQIHMVPTDTSGLYIDQGTDIGTAAIEIFTNNKPAVNVVTNGLVAGVFNTNLNTTGSYGYKANGSGIAFYADTTDVAAELNSSVTVSNMTQTGQLQANNTSPGLSLYRAFNLVSSFQTGTVTNSAGGTTVTGSGTSFTTLFSVGDYITIGGETQQISNVGSNTSLTTGTWTNAHSGANYSKRFDATGSLLNLVDNTAATGDLLTLTKSSTVVARFKSSGVFQYIDGNQGSGKVLTSDASGNASWTAASSGSVTSVALTMPSGFSVSGSPVTSSGTLAVTTSLSGVVKASAGSFTASAVSLTSEVTGILPVANGGTGTSTTFTTGSVVFAGASGIYTQDNANLFFDNTNDRLGVGTSIPSSRLELTTNSLGTTQTTTSGLALVNQTAAAAGAQQISPAVRWSGYGWGTTAGTSQAVDFRAYCLPLQSTTPNGGLVFEGSTSGGAYSNIITFYNTGNVSIGSSALPSSAKLWIQGSSSNTTLTSPSSSQQTVLYNSDTTANNYFGYTWYSNNTGSTPMIFGSMVGIYTVHTTSSESFAFAWLTRSSGTLAERMRLQADGNLTIGTTSNPGAKLHIQKSGGTAFDDLLTMYNVGNGFKASIAMYGDTTDGSATNQFISSVRGKFGTTSSGSSTLIFGTSSGEHIFLHNSNLYIGAGPSSGDYSDSSRGANLILNSGTGPSSGPTDRIHLYARDSSGGSANMTLALYTEEAPAADVGIASTHSLKIWVNGTEYYLPLKAV